MTTDGNNGNLVSSDKYNGKAVYGAEKSKIGSIERVMVDKSRGVRGSKPCRVRRVRNDRSAANLSTAEGLSVFRK